MGVTGVLIQDPCPLGLREILTTQLIEDAQRSTSKIRIPEMVIARIPHLTVVLRTWMQDTSAYVP